MAIFFAVDRTSPSDESGMSVNVRPWCLGITRACPRLRGWMSRKAKTVLDSKSLKEGISPGVVREGKYGWRAAYMYP